MATTKILEATSKLVAVLEPMPQEERMRVINAAFLLLGAPLDGTVGLPAAGAIRQAAAGTTKNLGGGSEKDFFDAKQPTNKGEELAVAARYREESADATASTKEELKAIFKAARRNFDDAHFARDLDNARTKGLFNRGSGKEAVLSHYGQNYVDALPDRERVKAIRRPKGAGARKSPAKRAAKKAAK